LATDANRSSLAIHLSTKGNITMRRSFLSAILFAAGLSLLVASLSPWLTGTPEAQARVQSRPTLTPAPIAPTTVPGPTRTPSSNDGDNRERLAPTGRITGTVIDLTTGAPAPGIAVQIGDVITTSDANGNYDRSGLAAGHYVVALALRVEQGHPAQEPLTVEVGADATVVQHLNFRSLPPARPAASPTAAPAGAAPATLPVTSGANDLSWPLVLLGLALLLGGGAVRAWR
jgi:hypothetical protein